MTAIGRLLVPALLLASPLLRAEAPPQDLWAEILGPAEGTIPADPGGAVAWRSDFDAALEEAKSADRPVLVTWRCLPCDQCAEFDKNVLAGSEALDPLLRRFVTVRLTDAAQLDERYFPFRTHQDLDLSWWAYFLSPAGDFYGVFGGKDHVSDATRISEAAFANSLRRVLAHHHDPRRPDWRIDLPMGSASKTRSGPKEMRGYDLLLAKRPGIGSPHPEHGSCLHCHQVGDMMIMEELDAGTFLLDDLTGKWPLPENVGIYLDRDDGLLVEKVTPGSPADAAGLEAGDRLGMASGMRLFGQADFRGVLHRAGKGADTIEVAWQRDGEVRFGSLQVEDGWRRTENWWRKTSYDGVYGPNMGFFPLKGPNFDEGKSMSIKPWMGPKPHERPVYQTGLRPEMEIIAIDGMREHMPMRKLITWFRFHYQPGDEVVYTVRDGTEYRFTLPGEE